MTPGRVLREDLNLCEQKVAIWIFATIHRKHEGRGATDVSEIHYWQLSVNWKAHLCLL